MLLKSVHARVCLAVSTDLEEAATACRLEARRDNRLSGGSAGAFVRQRSAVNDNQIN